MPAFDPRRFVGVAEYLLNRKPRDEAFDRSVINRLYYSAILVIREDARARRKDIPTDRSLHDFLATELRNHPHLSRRQRNDLANDLDTLRELRNSSDYGSTVGGTRRLVPGAKERTERIIRSINSVSR